MSVCSVGVLATDSRLTNITGVRIEMPFFDIFDPNEEVVDSSATWGDNKAGYYTSQVSPPDTQYAPIALGASCTAWMTSASTKPARMHWLTSAPSCPQNLNKKQTEKLVNQLEGVFDTAWQITPGPSEATAGSED